MKSGKRLSEELHRLAELCKDQPMTVKHFVEEIGLKAYAFLTLIFCIPFVFPLSIPGSSIIFGLFILLNGFRSLRGKLIWMPKIVQRQKLGPKFAASLLKVEKILKKLEKLIRPRGYFMTRAPSMQILNGVLLSLCGFFLALPTLPGTQCPPAISAVFLSIGILEEDGLFIGLGYFVFLLNVFFFIFLFDYSIKELSLLFSR